MYFFAVSTKMLAASELPAVFFLLNISAKSLPDAGPSRLLTAAGRCCNEPVQYTGSRPPGLARLTGHARGGLMRC